MKTGRLITPSIPQVCQGRLTTQSGEGLPTSDRTAQTTLYLTPWDGNRLLLWDGSNWKPHTFAELSLSLSGLSANTNYDVFIYDNSGTLTLQAVAWTNSTTRASAISRRNGVWVKSSDDRLLLGSFRTTASTGQTEQSLTKQFVSNVYNRMSISLQRTDTTSAWNYASSDWRIARSISTNLVEFVLALPQQSTQFTYTVYSQPTSSESWIGIGIDSTSAPHARNSVAISSYTHQLFTSLMPGHIAAGYHYAAPLEKITGVTPSVVYYGESTGLTLMQLNGLMMG